MISGVPVVQDGSGLCGRTHRRWALSSTSAEQRVRSVDDERSSRRVSVAYVEGFVGGNGQGVWGLWSRPADVDVGGPVLETRVRGSGGWWRNELEAEVRLLGCGTRSRKTFPDGASGGQEVWETKETRYQVRGVGPLGGQGPRPPGRRWRRSTVPGSEGPRKEGPVNIHECPVNCGNKTQRSGHTTHVAARTPLVLRSAPVEGPVHSDGHG